MLLVATVLPLLAILGYDHYSRYEADDIDARDDLRDDVERISGQLKTFLDGSAARLTQIAARPDVQALDPARCDPIVANYVTLDPQFVNVAELDGSGRNICSVLPIPSGSHSFAADKDWFRAAMSGKPAVSEPFVGPLSHRWVVVLVRPIRLGSGRVVGAVAAAIDLDRLQARYAKVNIHTARVIQVLSREGVVIARSGDRGANWIGRSLRGDRGLVDAMLETPAGFIKSGAGDSGRLHAWASVPDAGWRVEVSLPTAEIYGPVRDAATRDLVLIALATLAAAGVA
ncbi:MAG: hypothetical protein KGR23_09145, partial [Betaproteobacteria bacterium]|nr:hypothetical protein [Betaproteobacteria bacterium]